MMQVEKSEFRRKFLTKINKACTLALGMFEENFFILQVEIKVELLSWRIEKRIINWKRSSP